MKSFFLLIFLTLQSNANTFEIKSQIESCEQNPSFEALSKMEDSACEIEKKLKCDNILSTAPVELKDSYNTLCAPASKSLTMQASISCSGLTLYAGMQALSRFNPNFAIVLTRAIPVAIKKVAHKISPILGPVGIGLGVASGLSLVRDSLIQDQKCFENLERKKLEMELLVKSTEALKKRIQTQSEVKKVLIAANPRLQTSLESISRELTLPMRFSDSKYIKDLTCRQIEDFKFAQMRKESHLLSPLVAMNFFDKDPRIDLGLDQTDYENVKRLVNNKECFSPEKYLFLLCTIGNATIGGTQLVNLYTKSKLPIIKSFERYTQQILAVKPIPIPIPISNELKKNLGFSLKVSSAEKVNDYVITQNKITTKVEFVNDPVNGQRFEKVQVWVPAADQKNYNPVPSAINSVVYQRFAEKMGVKIMPDKKTVLRPADAKTHNEFIEKYNNASPDGEVIPIKFKDDFSKSGFTSEEIVRNFAKEGSVPINQVNPQLHGHDNFFHVEGFQLLPAEVVKRSRHNMNLVIELLETPAFKSSDSIRAHIFEQIGRSIDLSGIPRLTRPEFMSTRWNKLVLEPSVIRKLLEKVSAGKGQLDAFDKLTVKFRPQLNEKEVEEQFQIIKKRISED